MNGKKANVLTYTRKETNRKSYRQNSLPICSKIFEHLIYNEMFTFFTKNNLILPNQAGFRPGDSCVNQVLAITHNIFKSFNDEGFDMNVYFSI